MGRPKGSKNKPKQKRQTAKKVVAQIKKTASPVGRRPSWNPDFVEIVEHIIANGGSHIDCYNAIGVTHQTFYRWAKEKSDFSEAIERGRKAKCMLVESALTKRIFGYDYEEKTNQTTTNPDGTQTIIEKTVTKHVIPDVTAILAYLRKNMPEVYGDNIEETQQIVNENVLITGEDVNNVLEKLKQNY